MLTDERISEIAEAGGMDKYSYQFDPIRYCIAFARAIEKELTLARDAELNQAGPCSGNGGNSAKAAPDLFLSHPVVGPELLAKARRIMRGELDEMNVDRAQLQALGQHEEKNG